MGDRSQAGFGVPHGSRRIVIHGSEVAVAIQQGVAAGEGLHQPHQSVVDRLITVRVILAEHIAHDAGAFAVRPIRCQAQFVHRVEDAALHRLEAIAGIGQGPTHDHAHRVLEVGALHLLMQGDRLNALLGHPDRKF